MKRFQASEDWTANITGFLIIVLTLFQIKPSWPVFTWKNSEGFFDKVLNLDNLGHILIVFGFMWLLSLFAGKISGKPMKNIVKGFPVIFVLTLIAQLIGGNQFMQDWGLETVIFSLLIGLFISNVLSVPEWLKESLSSELFVKIGLVLLGTSVIFGNLLQSGALGLIQSILVVICVWYFCFWVCRKLKIDKELSIMLSSAVSICGVSAAIASAGAIRGDKTKLSYVVSLVLIVAIPMIILMPFLAKWMGLPETVAGAWIGGTIDTTGAVVATGSIYGQKALETATIVKFSQNVLLGIAAFFISIYWSYTGQNKSEEEKPTARIIWERFPKFVLGFIITSLVFSFLIAPDVAADSQKIIKKLQGMWFALAFTSIGLETQFKSLINTQNKKATLAFLGAQAFNIVFTLILASILFGAK